MSDAAGQISLETASKLIMVSPRHVQRLCAEGWIPKPADRGQYTVVGVVQGYIKFLQDEARRSSQSAAKSRRDDARAREIELRIAKQERELIPIEEAEQIVMSLSGSFKSALLGLPARVTTEVGERQQLRSHVDNILGDISRRCSEAGQALATSG